MRRSGGRLRPPAGSSDSAPVGVEGVKPLGAPGFYGILEQILNNIGLNNVKGSYKYQMLLKSYIYNWLMY